MKIRIPAATIVLAAWLLAPTPGTAQQHRGPGPGPGFSVLQHLIGQADSLGLSSSQQEELAEIQSRLEEESSPLFEELQDLRSRGDRQSMRSEARPLMEELRDLHDEALEEALDLMEGPQRTLAEEMATDFRQEQRHRRGRRGRRPL